MSPILPRSSVVDARVALLEDAAALVAPHLLVPQHLHSGHRRRDQAIHTLLHDIHLHYIRALGQRVAQAPHGAASEVELHQQRGVVDLLGGEVECRRVEALAGRTEHESVARVLGAADIHLHGVYLAGLGVFVDIGVIVLEGSLCHAAAVGVQFEFQHIVAELHKALLAGKMAGESAIAVGLLHGAAQMLGGGDAVLQRQVVAEARCHYVGIGQHGVAGLHGAADLAAADGEVNVGGAVAHGAGLGAVLR